MPATSKSQFRAMQAAAHGKSTIGIPKKVGEEFVDATPKGSYKKMPEKKHNATNRMKVRALRECKAHDKCVVAQMEEPESPAEDKGEGPEGLEPRAIADHHVPASESHLYQPGAMVDLHAVPVKQDDEEPPMKEGESRPERRKRMAARFEKMKKG